MLFDRERESGTRDKHFEHAFGMLVRRSLDGSKRQEGRLRLNPLPVARR